MKLPPIPKWNATTDDIDLKDFCRRSLNYERSLLPSDVVFPQAEQIWATVRNCHVFFRAWSNVNCDRVWFPQSNLASQPATSVLSPVGKARLAKGERVRICHVDDESRPLQVVFLPLRYDELLDSIVPEEQQKTLAHYELYLRTAPTLLPSRDEVGYFCELFRLIAK